MDPDGVRLALARRTGFAAPGAAPEGPRNAVLASISSSYFRLRRGLAVLALALPLVLWLGADPARLQGSISAYYHFAPDHVAYGGGTMRDVFIGALWTIGAFLFFYRGYSRAEDRALNVAGLAAVTLSLCPMDWPAGSATTPTGIAHQVAGFGFFAAIAYVALFRARDTLVLLPAEAQRRFALIYRILGGLMIVLPLIVTALHVVTAPSAGRNVMLWAIEVGAITTFAAFWLTKSREIAAIERGR